METVVDSGGTNDTRLVRAVRRTLDRTEKWYGRLFLIGLVLTVAGALAIPLCVRRSAVTALVVSVLATAVGLALLNPGLRRWADGRRLLFLGIGMASFVLGAGLLVVAFTNHTVWLGIAGVFFEVTGVLTLRAVWRISQLKIPAPCAPLGLVLLPLGLLVLQRGGLWRVLGGVLAVGGIVLYTSGLRRYTAQVGRGVRWLTWTGALTVGVGTACLVEASRSASRQWAIVGALLTMVGVIAMSLSSGSLRARPAIPVSAGLATIVAGVYLLQLRLNTTFALTAAVTLLVFLLAASFVVRGEVFLLVVAVGLAAVWLVDDRTATAPLDPNPDAETRVLALGDSYISGEGSPEFFAGTNTKGPEKNECRRSPAAFPYLLAERKGWGLDFFACSGAKAGHIHQDIQMPESPADIVGGLPQLQNINPETKDKIKLVLVSIGGNDASFGHIGRGCILPGSCAERREVWLGNLDQIGDGIAAAFTAIRTALPGVPVVVVPYPRLITSTGCKESVLVDDEHAFISEFLAVLNDRVRVSAANAGVHYLGDNLFSFRGAGICESEAQSAMNVANVNPTDGELVDRITPTNWLHGSLHPTPAGHELVARLLDDYLPDDLSAMAPNPEPDTNAAFRIRNVGGATPALYNPTDLKAPPGIACPTDAPTIPFATRLRVFEPARPIVVEADPSEMVCYTGPDGSWMSGVPGPTGDVTVTNDVVRVAPYPLGSRSAPEEQRIVYRDNDGNWQLRLVAFCSTIPGCANEQGEFINQQLANAARELAIPILLVFAGGWLSTVGFSGITRRVVGRAAR